MNEERVKANVRAVLDYCTKLTLQLVRLSPKQRQVKGIASGFFIKVDGSTFLVSAGHALTKHGWAIETTLANENESKTACIPVRGTWTLKRFTLGKQKAQKLDIAWAKVDVEDFQKAIGEVKGLTVRRSDFLIYHGPLEDRPNPKEVYVYAAANRSELVSALGKTHMVREYSYEYEMEYKGITKGGLYIFSIPKHKGHKYYKGASGAPIIEPSGKVLAVFVQGLESKNELYGYPTTGLVELIRIGEQTDGKNYGKTATFISPAS
jgi:hypothetical protein